MPQRLTLAEKLAQAAASIPDLEKQGDNGEYTYLRAYDVLKAFRKEIFSRGIAIVPTKILDVVRSQPYLTVTENIIDEVRVTVEYEISDGEQTICGQGIGVGQDYQGKALYMALTGSLKFFVQAVALIAGIPDDPEFVPGDPPASSLTGASGFAEKLDEAERKYGNNLGEHPISRNSAWAWGRLCQLSGLRSKARENYLKENFGLDNILDLKRKDYPAAIRWAKKEEDVNEPPGVDS